MRWALVLLVACADVPEPAGVGESCSADGECMSDMLCAECGVCAYEEDLADCNQNGIADGQEDPLEGAPGGDPSPTGGGGGGTDDDPATVGGYIVCDDGTVSPTCTECTTGCCSGHGGCTGDGV